MSVRAIQWALEAHVERATEKLVLIVLANYADEHGECYPSGARICEETCLNRKTVQAALRVLKANGFLTDTGERRGLTKQVIVYRLSLTKEAQKRASKRGPKTEQAQKRNSTESGQERGPKTDIEEAQKRATEPLEEPSVEPLGCTARAREEIAFEKFCELAREVGLPQPQALTPDRRSKLTARLKECGGLEGWEAALVRIRGSPFLLGQVPGKDWKASFDFVLQKNSFRKLMEGNYDGGKNGSNGGADKPLPAYLAALTGCADR